MAAYFGRRLLFRFAVRVLRRCSSVCLFPFVSEGGISDLIWLVPDRCLSLSTFKLYVDMLFTKMVSHCIIGPEYILIFKVNCVSPQMETIMTMTMNLSSVSDADREIPTQG